MTDPDGQPRLAAMMAERLRRLTAAEPYKIGFPGWSAPFPGPLVPFLSRELNNCGDPEIDPVFSWHTKDLERDLIRELAGLFGASPARSSGYVTSSGSEGVLHGLWRGRRTYPEAHVYHSAAAHPCVARSADLLRLKAVSVPADGRGEMDYDMLRRLLEANPNPAAIVVPTIGTAMTEAVDNLPRIRSALLAAGKERYYLHADAAMAGIPLALCADGPPAFGLHPDGADSLSVSGHKFLGAPFPCGVFLARAKPAYPPQAPDWPCGAPDSATSSRSGHAVLLLWYLVNQYGRTGLLELAHRGQALAEYAERRLTQAGWPAWRAHKHAQTVVFESPQAVVRGRWAMPAVDGLSHIVCTPAVTLAKVDEFVAAVSAAIRVPAQSR